MSLQTIYAEKTVSVTELRKKPCEYFIDEPVAVLSNNKTAGYMVSAELFEQMVGLIEAHVRIGSFRPTSERLRQVAEKGAEYLLNSTEEALKEFKE